MTKGRSEQVQLHKRFQTSNCDTSAIILSAKATHMAELRVRGGGQKDWVQKEVKNYDH